MYPDGVDDITLHLDRRSSSTLPSSSSLIPTLFVRGGPLIWDQAIGKTREVLKRGQSLCTVGTAEAEGDEVEFFASPCQPCFKVLLHIREGMDSLGRAAVLEKVSCKPPVIEVFCPSEEGSKSRINRIEHGSDPTR